MDNQLIVFEDKEANIVIVTNALKATNGSSSRLLGSFRDLSKMINTSTGNVPVKVQQTLRKLAAAYAVINTTVKDGLAVTAATMGKFIIKTRAVLLRGSMTAADRDVLLKLGTTLNTDYVKSLTAFVEASRQDLIELHGALVDEAVGGRLKGLLSKKVTIEAELVVKGNAVTQAAIKVGVNQGKIDELEYELQLTDGKMTDLATAKASMKAEVERLQHSIPAYEEKVQQHRDAHTEERGSFWIFQWKVRDIHVNNGESIAREDLSRLLNRIRELQHNIDHLTDDDLVSRRKIALEQLPRFIAQMPILEAEHAQLQAGYNETEGQFKAIIQEMNAIFVSAGTQSADTIAMVDQLARAVFDGYEALSSGYAAVKMHLTSIDTDPDLLVPSVLDALKLITMADEYNGTQKLDQCKRVWAITD